MEQAVGGEEEEERMIHRVFLFFPILLVRLTSITPGLIPFDIFNHSRQLFLFG